MVKERSLTIMNTSDGLTGQKFGKLTVICEDTPKKTSKGHNIRMCKCRCDCGKEISVRMSYLKSGHTISCGCSRHKRPHNFVDYSGQKFGRLTVIRALEPEEVKTKTYNWLCQCECGNIIHANISKLKDGHTTSCGCKLKENKGSKFEDLTGQRFGRLTVVRFLQAEERRTRGFDWFCKCDCGNDVYANVTKLKQGDMKSCGCLKSERIGNINKKYKYTNKRLYAVYAQIIDRINNPKSREYHNYGGRGIKLCDEWTGEYGYDEFAKWAFENGYNPDAKHGECTIDRIDVNGNYEPDNCKWVDNDSQQNNRRDCIYIDYNGKTQTMAQWSRELNIPYGFLNWRMIRSPHKRTLQECIEEYQETK